MRAVCFRYLSNQLVRQRNRRRRKDMLKLCQRRRTEYRDRRDRAGAGPLQCHMRWIDAVAGRDAGVDIDRFINPGRGPPAHSRVQGFTRTCGHSAVFVFTGQVTGRERRKRQKRDAFVV